MAAPIHLGPPPAPQQGPEMGHRPLLRHLQQDQERHVGLRRPHSGAYLHKYAWTKIVRHVVVTGRASPDDPALARYWADRRRKQPAPQLADSWHKALRAQAGTCPLCGNQLLDAGRPDSASQAEAWYAALRATLTFQASTARTAAGPPTASYTPTATAATQTTGQRARTADAEPARPRGLLEPCEATSSSTVLREGGHCKVAPLLDRWGRECGQSSCVTSWASCRRNPGS